MSLQRVIDELGSYFRGWWGYFGIVESVNRLRPLAHWVRRRLRSLVWKQWKSARRARAACNAVEWQQRSAAQWQLLAAPGWPIC